MKDRKSTPKIPTPNFIPENRSWNLIKKHSPIVLESMLIAIIFMLFWRYILYPLDIHFSKHANEVILFMIAPMAGSGYALFAFMAVNSVFYQYQKISRSVVQNEMREFLTYRDEQLPIKIHLLIGAPSFFLAFLALSFNYEQDISIGAFSVFSVIFLLTFAWKIATDLDNFQNSVWFQKKVPPAWYEADVHKYFYENKEEKK